MNQTQALAKVRKLVGPKAGFSIRKTVPVGEERAAEIARRKVLTEQLKALTEARDARRLEVLNADAEYVRLRTEVQAMTKERDSLHACYHHRVEVIRNVEAFGMTILGGGDNFEEAIASIKTTEAA